jgi:hypothetical protein
VLIPAGSSSATFFYGDPTPGNPAITAATTTSTAVQNESVSPAVLFFVISGPVSGPASTGANIGPVTVLVTDLSGQPLAAPSGGTTVKLGSSSGTGLFSASRGGQPVTSVQIPAGASEASFFYGDPTPGSPTIQMSVPFARPTSQQETIGAPVPTQLGFTTNPVTGAASNGANLGPITVQILDSLGNPVVAPAGGTAVDLGSSSGTGVFAATANGQTTTSIQMPAGATSATFYYGDPTPGNPEIIASADGLSANQQASVTAVGRLAFATGPATGAASSSANLGITVQLQDNSGQPMAASTDTTVGLTATHNGSGGERAATTSQPLLVPAAFRGPGGCQPPLSNGVFASSPGGPPITSVTIPAGQDSVTFYFGDPSAGTDTITMTAPQLTSSSQDETITAGAPSKVAICGPSQLSGPASSSANLGPVSLSLLDALGNVAVAPTGGRTVNLSSTSTGAVFAASSGGTRLTSLTIPAGSSSASFFYGDTTAGSPTITASSPGLGSATLTVSIISAIQPTTTTLSAVPASPNFGQKVTLKATVATVPPGQGAPTGQVKFTDGASTLGTVSLDSSGHASLSILPLAPGPHSIVASYGGDANDAPSPSAPDALSVGCSSVSGNHSGRLTISVPTCLQGATISGPVVIQPGAALSISQSRVIGQVSSNGAAAVRICGSTITGSVSLQSSNGLVIVGDAGDDGAPGCGPNNLGAPVTLSGNKGVIELGGDTVAGPVKVTGNAASGIDPEHRAPEIEANRISGPLSCSGNIPPPTNDGLRNQVSGPRTGQCTGL